MSPTSENPTFLDALVAMLEVADRYNGQAQVPEAAVLWTDDHCQWESLLPPPRSPRRS